MTSYRNPYRKVFGPIGALGAHRPLSDSPDDCRSYSDEVSGKRMICNYVANLFIWARSLCTFGVAPERGHGCGMGDAFDE